jgi:hypothetical protein
MQIIFDKELAKQLEDKYTVLELDTVMQEGLSEPVVLYAIINTTDLGEMMRLDELKEQHQQLISRYKSGDWNSLDLYTSVLKGKFAGELDSFYDNIQEFMDQGKPKDWKGVRHTVPVVDNDT